MKDREIANIMIKRWERSVGEPRTDAILDDIVTANGGKIGNLLAADETGKLIMIYLGYTFED